ncbi:hypothetical protein [Altibacter sp.]|nr:hypothetical protein [Altibacter sp.]
MGKNIIAGFVIMTFKKMGELKRRREQQGEHQERCYDILPNIAFH